nr:hypothetical protein [Tanacetum cinerariifolium]
MSLDSHATITYTLMSSYEVIVNGYFGMPMDPLDLYVQLVMEVPPSPDYIPEPEAPPLLDYIPGSEYLEYLPPADDVFLVEEQPLPATVSPTAEGDDDDDLSEDDADDEDEEESSDSETAAAPPPSAYRVISMISVRPHIPMPFLSESEVERLLAIPTPPLSPVSSTSYPLPPFLMPLPIFTPLPPPPPIILPHTRASMILTRSAAPSTFILVPLSRTPPIGTPPLEGIPELDMPLQKRARFTTPTGGYKIMDYCQSREVHTSTLVTQIEALQRDVSTLQGQQINDGDRLTRRIQHEHAQRDAAPEDGHSYS